MVLFMISIGVVVNRRVHWNKGNNLFAYDQYLNEVYESLESINIRS